MRFEIYQSGTSQPTQVWRWRLVSSNGKIVADSAEGYARKADCEHGIELVKGTSAATPVMETW